MRRERAKLAFPEQEDVLAVQRHVRVGRKEARTEERVRPVGRFLPEDVRERCEAEPGHADHGLGRVRPDLELPVDRTQGISDVDREDAPGDQDPSTLDPRVGKDLQHAGIVARPERPEEVVPLRDHRVRGRREDQVDRPVRDRGELARIPVDEPDEAPRWQRHARGKPWHD